MADNSDKNHLNLLMKLCKVLQNPDMPTLLERLSQPEQTQGFSSGTNSGSETQQSNPTPEDGRITVLKQLEESVDF